VITPNAQFYRIDTALLVPQVDPADWSLRIHGMVQNEITITWDELLALPLEESITTLACVSNEVGGDLIGNALWLGYPIRELLARAVADAGGRAPSVLIYSAEPHVPWELAVVEELPGHRQGDTSPFLGARVALGRWPHGEPPPARDPLIRRVRVTERAIVCGDYNRVNGWPKLEAAEKEALGFHDAWPGSALVDAEYHDVRNLIRGDPPADLLHFAMHGQLSDRASQNGLVLIRRTPEPPEPLFLQPSQVRAAADGLERRPFVFLNACQVGAGQRILGDYGGMAVAFLAIGAAAIVAPVWSVNDIVASKAAKSFYEVVLGDEQVPVAEALRAARARFTEATMDTAGLEAATYLAYSYFGHPKLTLTTGGS
jgi:hypothetical protein